jgi:hypothetical protein
LADRNLGGGSVKTGNFVASYQRQENGRTSKENHYLRAEIAR